MSEELNNDFLPEESAETPDIMEELLDLQDDTNTEEIEVTPDQKKKKLKQLLFYYYLQIIKSYSYQITTAQVQA